MPPFFATDNVLPDAAAAVVVVSDEPAAGEELELVDALLDEFDPPHPAAISTAANRTVETSFEGFTVLFTDESSKGIAVHEWTDQEGAGKSQSSMTCGLREPPPAAV